jgi:DNA mismatch endonuclease Vsr
VPSSAFELNLLYINNLQVTIYNSRSIATPRPRYKTLIFVHGCFWHRHEDCKEATTPKTRTEFWQDKFDKNVARDKRNIEDLEILGWNVIVIWECELKDPDEVMRSIKRRLNPQTAAYIVRPTPPLLAAEEVAGYSAD